MKLGMVLEKEIVITLKFLYNINNHRSEYLLST